LSTATATAPNDGPSITVTVVTPEDNKPSMAERIAEEQANDPVAHEWIVAAEVAIDHKTARRASFRGSFRSEGGMRIDALETYCRKCRRPLDDVEEEPCSAKIDNTHLIGGDPTTREKRIKHTPVGPVHTVPVTRIGMAGFSVGQFHGR
jgi:hypothetical protein